MTLPVSRATEAGQREASLSAPRQLTEPVAAPASPALLTNSSQERRPALQICVAVGIQHPCPAVSQTSVPVSALHLQFCPLCGSSQAIGSLFSSSFPDQPCFLQRRGRRRTSNCTACSTRLWVSIPLVDVLCQMEFSDVGQLYTEHVVYHRVIGNHRPRPSRSLV